MIDLSIAKGSVNATYDIINPMKLDIKDHVRVKDYEAVREQVFPGLLHGTSYLITIGAGRGHFWYTSDNAVPRANSKNLDLYFFDSGFTYWLGLSIVYSNSVVIYLESDRSEIVQVSWLAYQPYFAWIS